MRGYDRMKIPVGREAPGEIKGGNTQTNENEIKTMKEEIKNLKQTVKHLTGIIEGIAQKLGVN